MKYDRNYIRTACHKEVFPPLACSIFTQMMSWNNELLIYRRHVHHSPVPANPPSLNFLDVESTIEEDLGEKTK